jgi:hypothetical protein
MSPEQQKRQDVTPGLTGLAQVNGRNAIDWEQRIAYDLQYIDHITFLGDCRIIFKTVACVFGQKDINQGDSMTYETMGEFLVRRGKLSKEAYEEKSKEIAIAYANYHL